MTPEREAEIVKQLEGYAPIIEYVADELPAIQALISASRYELYLLSTGKVVRANRGILGLDEEGTLTDGYDGVLEHAQNMDNPIGEWDEVDYPATFTPAERVELADIAIKRWQEFREKWAKKP